MNIACPECRKRLLFADDQLLSYPASIAVTCPGCGAGITLDRREVEQQVLAAYEALPSGNELTQLILRDLDRLPPMPQVAIMARRIVADPAANFLDLARVIEMDQAIAASVLKLANSAFYGSPGKVTSIRQAASTLGTRALHELLTLACTGKLLGRTLPGYDLEAKDLWRHSLTVAAASRVVARRSRPALEEDAFTVGLIHDAGKLIIDTYLAERRGLLTSFLDQRKFVTFLSVEQRVLGVDHAEMAASACLRWNFAEGIVQAVRHHHQPQASPERDLAAIVHLADGIALMSGLGSGIDGMLYELDEAVFGILGIVPDQINDIMDEATEYAKNIADLS